MSLLAGAQNVLQTEQRLNQLRNEHSTISLLGQLPLDEEDARILGQVLREEIAFSTSDCARLKAQGRLTLACFLVWMGREHYDKGTYWEKVEKALDRQGRVWQQLWGDIFLDAIARYHLTAFHSKGLKYVTPILLHGGIPDYCLPDFFKKVLYPIVKGAIDFDSNSSEELLLEWRAHPSLYQTTDKPVRRFLEEGGRPAADFLDRCVEMARAAYYENQIPAAEELGLPERVVERFNRWWKESWQPTLPEQRLALSRPRIELDTYNGEVRCCLPEQIMSTESDAPVLLDVKADERQVCACEVPSYVRTQRLLTDQAEYALLPARRYAIRLEQRPSLAHEWTFQGLDADNWIAFDDRGALIRASELPRDTFWLGFDNRLKLDENVRVIETIEGAGEWEAYRFHRLDPSDAESLALIKADGARVSLPLAQGKEPQLCGEALTGCNAEGLAVYTGRLPTVQIPLSRAEEIDAWDVIVEDHAAKSRKHTALREVAKGMANGKVIVPLSQEVLLGEPLIGEYRVKLRARGALGRDKQFHFAFVRDLQYDFEKAFFLSNERVRLTLMATPALNILSEETATHIKVQDGVALIEAEVDGRLLRLRLEAGNRRQLTLAFVIPRLRWTVRGLTNHLATGWLAETLEAQTEDFEASDEAMLIVQLPLADGSFCALELEGAGQRSEAKTRHGEARFSLSRFRDSLRSLNKPVVRFSLSFSDALRGEQRVYPLAVRARWAVERFQCQDTRIVSFRWEERGHYQNRRIRLWNLFQVWESPKEFAVPEGESEIELRVPVAELPAGKYRVELFMQGEFDTPTPMTLPRRNGVDVFDLSLGEEALVSGLLSPDGSFRIYLMRRLAGYEDSFDLSSYPLATDDGDDLMRVLLFLVGEERLREVKQLWFNDLRNQTKQAEVRKLLRQQIKLIAERGDDEMKRDLLAVCKTIGLSVNSLIPFAVGSKVRFENKVVKYTGISKWEYQSTGRLNDEPWDMISLDEHSRLRKVRLSFLDAMKQAPDDAPLS